MKKLVLITLLLTVNWMFGQTEWIRFKNETFSISHPEDWNPDTSGSMNTQLILFSQLTGEDDPFKENVNIISQNLKGQNITMKDFVTLTENQIKTMVPNGKVWESEGNNERHSIVISGFVENNNLKFKQLYLLKDDTLYIITFTTLENAYDDYKAIGDKILNSFKLN